MPPDAHAIDLTVRGVPLSDETIHFVRRCSRRMLEQTGVSNRSVSVLLERQPRSEEAHAYVALADGPVTLRARGRDIDVLLAIRDAFDRLTQRLLDPRAPTRTGLSLLDESLASMRVAARRLGHR